MENKKYKVGIFTLPLHHNYGGVLQAFALSQILSKNDFDVWLINHNPEHTTYKKLKLHIRNIILKYIFKKNILIRLKKDQQITDCHVINFIKKHFPQQTINYHNNNYYKFDENNFDIVIVGSDQVWRKQYVRNDLFHYFLDFTKSKKIAYAASFGLPEWQYTDLETKKIENLLKEFTSISVREKSAKDLITINLNLQSTQVIDPALLLNISEYKQLIDTNEHINKNLKGDIFTYILDSNQQKRNCISEIEKKNKLSAFSVLNEKYENYQFKSNERIMPPIEEWLYGLSKAKYVITDSFHGCVFAILFNKPFLVFANKERGLARFTSLLELFSLEYRIIEDTQYFDFQILDMPINWDSVNATIEKKRKEATNFLLNSLK